MRDADPGLAPDSAGMGLVGSIYVPKVCPAKSLRLFIPLRLSILRTLILLLGALAPAVLWAQHPHSSPPPAPHPSSPHSSPSPAPHYNSPAPNHPTQYGPQPPGSQHRPSGQEHLDEWLQKNNGLSSQQKIQKLQQEKGFNQLTPQQQQNATNRLRQLDQLPPQQRQRVLERVENLERLSPQQQQQVRGSARELGQMPPDRQQAVKDAIRNLRNVPPGQRQSELNSKYSNQLSPQERGIVGNLLSVESYHPPASAPPQ